MAKQTEKRDDSRAEAECVLGGLELVIHAAEKLNGYSATQEAILAGLRQRLFSARVQLNDYIADRRRMS